MTQQAIIQQTVQAIQRLPEAKVAEISRFVEDVVRRYEAETLTAGLTHLAATGSAFDFLAAEDDLYTEADLKEVYDNGQG